ncbi:MAG TPA: hypothetical protein VEH56_08260 [Candidatus Saccharimonadales bacterium]|nr:hypothetical protein [Candidatus Saccharimonadales bacterium]
MTIEGNILVLAPTIFFFVTMAWGSLFQKFTMNEIEEVDHPHFEKVKELLTPHFFQVTYSDAIFLFMVNGIIEILQFANSAFGVILMVVGVVVAVTGLLTSFMWRYPHGKSASRLIMPLTIAVALIQFILLLLTT